MSRRSTLTLFCGLPGSGKTRIAKQLERQTGDMRICTDDWMADLGVDLYDEPFRDALQIRLYVLAKELISRGVDVILEDGLWSKPERDEKRADARRLGVRTRLYVFDLSLEEQWRRLEHRNNSMQYGAVAISYEQLQKYTALFELPAQQELNQFDEYFVYRDTTSLVL